MRSSDANTRTVRRMASLPAPPVRIRDTASTPLGPEVIEVLLEGLDRVQVVLREDEPGRGVGAERAGKAHVDHVVAAIARRQHRSPIADGRTHARAGVGRPGEISEVFVDAPNERCGRDGARLRRGWGSGAAGPPPGAGGTGRRGRLYFVPVVRSVAARRGVFGVSVVRAVGLFAAACQPAKPPPPPPPPPDFQPGFQESVVFGGLSTPTVVAFSPDGRVFVGEKSGIIKVFDNLSDPTPTIFADLRTNVYDYWDRGLLGMALDPSFPAKPYVYVLYTRDAVIGGAAPLWSDDCPTPPGPVFGAGCQASGRLSRLQASGNQMVG